MPQPVLFWLMFDPLPIFPIFVVVILFYMVLHLIFKAFPRNSLNLKIQEKVTPAHSFHSDLQCSFCSLKSTITGMYIINNILGPIIYAFQSLSLQICRIKAKLILASQLLLELEKSSH